MTSQRGTIPAPFDVCLEAIVSWPAGMPVPSAPNAFYLVQDVMEAAAFGRHAGHLGAHAGGELIHQRKELVGRDVRCAPLMKADQVKVVKGHIGTAPIR